MHLFVLINGDDCHFHQLFGANTLERKRSRECIPIDDSDSLRYSTDACFSILKNWLIASETVWQKDSEIPPSALLPQDRVQPIPSTQFYPYPCNHSQSGCHFRAALCILSLHENR